MTYLVVNKDTGELLLKCYDEKMAQQFKELMESNGRGPCEVMEDD